MKDLVRIEKKFEFLSHLHDKGSNKDTNPAKQPAIGDWVLSYEPGFGGFRIEEIINEDGARATPFGMSRMELDEFESALDFAIEITAMITEKVAEAIMGMKNAIQ